MALSAIVLIHHLAVIDGGESPAREMLSTYVVAISLIIYIHSHRLRSSFPILDALTQELKALPIPIDPPALNSLFRLWVME